MYEIKVLSNKDFDEVAHSDERYSYVDENNLGFADREKGVAYVRQTGIHDLNKYLISHELEELEMDDSTHEDPNGIRHKKFFKDFFLPLISGGAIKPEAPQREAAQTTYVEGVGHVPSSQASFYQPPMSGSYSPSGSLGQSGGFGSPLNLFSGSGSYTPQTVPAAASGSYPPGFLGGGLNDLPDYLKQQRFGAESGRIVF